jgi:thioredoxin-related protein
MVYSTYDSYLYLVIFILLCIIYYLYNINDKIKVYWFFRPGCPHCDNMEKQWSNVEGHMWGPHVEVKRIDTSKPENAEIATNFNITGVPQIIKIKSNGMRYTYEGERKSKKIIKWIVEDHNLKI